MKHIGIDIGTTTICGAVLDGDGNFVESITEKNGSFLPTETGWERMQNPSIILDTVFGIASRLTEKYPDIASVGVTGQMHGILYTDREGKSVSPLYTWQDARGDLPYLGEETYAQYASRTAGVRMASGYGAVTHFYNTVNHLVPKEAVSLCTIADYVVMRLCGLEKPFLHSGNAASIGCFDLKKLCFDREAAERLGLSADFFPAVTSDAETAGYYRGIPVAVSIGDNQASFIGSGADESSILINVGTGSQISLVSPYTETEGSVELRPFLGDRYLLVGSSLSGGRAYAVLEKLFRAVVSMAGYETDSLYPCMDKALENYTGDSTLSVSTLFDGSRDNPTDRGSISGIGVDNLTPEQLMLGFSKGIAEELYGMYEKMGKPEKTSLIGSGNGIRRNKALSRAAEELFRMTLSLSPFKEEAACGAAKFAVK